MSPPHCPKHPAQVLDDNAKYGGWGGNGVIGRWLYCVAGDHYVAGSDVGVTPRLATIEERFGPRNRRD